MLEGGKGDVTGAGLVVPADNLTAAGAILGTGAMVFVAKTRAGLQSNLMGDVTKDDVPATGEESPRLTCNCGRADTNFVTLDIKDELRDWAPTNLTGAGSPTVGVRTTTGDLRAGTLGTLGRGEIGNEIGAAETGLSPAGGAAAGLGKLPVLGV